MLFSPVNDLPDAVATKPSEYSSAECLQRLQTLQRVCAAERLDALLLVGGVDGRHHAGSREALGWLLGGESGRVVFGRAESEVDLDEVVVLIAPASVRLYCPAAVYKRLAARLALWPRLQLFRPAEALEDAEQLEEHKIRAFIAMAGGLKSVGVPLPEGGGSGDAKAIELWPLIQAYALQDFEAVTGGGFFTQRHRCVPCGRAIGAPLSLVDARALRWLVEAEAPRLRGSWDDCERQLDGACGAKPLRHSEAALCEPLTTYADYGLLARRVKPGDDAPPPPPADELVARTRLLLGARTAACVGEEGSSAERPGAPGASEAQPRHLLLEAAEPHGPLYAGRTYFLGLGAAAPPSAPSSEPERLVEQGSTSLKDARARVAAARAASAAAASASATEDARAADTLLLQSLYGALHAALDEALEEHGLGATAARLEAAVGAGVSRRAAASELALPEGWVPRVAVRLQYVDAVGVARGATLGSDGARALACEGRLLVQLRAALLDVPAPTDAATPSGGTAAHAASAAADGTLGAVVVGQTFVASDGGGIAALSGALPPFGCWRAPGVEFNAAHELLSSCEAIAAAREDHTRAPPDAPRRPPAAPDHPLLGALLAAPVSSCALLSGGAALPPTPVTLYAFENGAVLAHARMGALLIRFDGATQQPRAVTLHEEAGGSLGGDGGGVAARHTVLAFELPPAALEGLLGAAAGLLRAGGAPDAAAAAAGDGTRSSHVVGVACVSVAARRALLRDVLAPWKQQWQRHGIAYAVADDGAPMPLLGAPRLAAPSLAQQWPTRAVGAALARRAAAEAALLAAPPAAGGKAGAAAAPTAAAPVAAAPTATGGEVLVVLVAGLPGSGAAAAAAGLVDATRSAANWLVAPPALAWCDGGGCDAAALRAALEPSLAAANLGGGGGGSGGGGGAPARMAIVAESLAPLPALVAALEVAFAGLPLRLAAAVAVVDAPRALRAEAAPPAVAGAAAAGAFGGDEGGERCAPGVLELASGGFAQTVLLCNTEELSAEALSPLTRALDAACPLASVVRAPRLGGARAAAPSLAQLACLDDQAGSADTGSVAARPLPFEAASQRALRELIAPGWRQLGGYAGDAALEGVCLLRLPSPPPCSLPRLLRVLRAAMAVPPAAAPSAAAAATAALAAVAMGPEDGEAEAAAEAEALAHLRAGASLMLVQGRVDDAARGEAFELDLSPRAFRTPRAAAAAAAAGAVAVGASELLVACRGAAAKEVAALLLACRGAPTLVARVDEASLPQPTMDELRRCAEAAALPEGVFYDGRGYVDMDGEWSAQHPALRDAVDNELRRRNAEVDALNAGMADRLAKLAAEADGYMERVGAAA